MELGLEKLVFWPLPWAELQGAPLFRGAQFAVRFLTGAYACCAMIALAFFSETNAAQQGFGGSVRCVRAKSGTFAGAW
jgi:hypothetical protein